MKFVRSVWRESCQTQLLQVYRGGFCTLRKYSPPNVLLCSENPPKNTRTRHASAAVESMNGRARHVARPALTIVSVLEGVFLSCCLKCRIGSRCTSCTMRGYRWMVAVCLTRHRRKQGFTRILQKEGSDEGIYAEEQDTRSGHLRKRLLQV